MNRNWSQELHASESDVVLDVLNAVHALDDVQQIVDKVCECVAAICPFELALLSLYFGPDVYIGLQGGNEAMRRDFLRVAREQSDERRARKRDLIWSNHRFPDTNICFIPAGSDVPFSSSFAPSEALAAGEWQPEDRLMVFVRGADGDVRGVLSLDIPRDGRRPDPARLGPLEAVDRLMKLMGVLIHNKHLAAKLKESEERYAAVVEQGHDGILITRDGRVLFANRRMASMIGAEPAHLAGRPTASILRAAEATSLPGEEEAVLVRDDGREVDIALRTSTIRVGGETATLLAAADITDRKRVLAQLLRSQKMDSVGTLASGIAHDFNNLLGGITGYASLLRLRLDPEHPAAKYVGSIEKAADRAAAVTRQLLGIVRDEPVRVAPFRCDGLLEDLARLLRETFDPSITVELRCAADLPLVVGDETQIHQVLLNICLNSRDAMQDGGTLTIVAERARRRDGTAAVRLLLRDTGIGMDRATIGRVFDPFFTTKSGGQGTGLGLYMAYRVIERHGGTIDLASTPGSGTVVEIVLPASVASSVAGKAAPPPSASSFGGKVLVVDDEEIMRAVGREMLDGLGYEVVSVDDGLAAVHAIEADPDGFRCILLDIAMPVMNGWEAARRIRAIRADLPIIISSGHDPSASTGDTRGLSIEYFLKKPYRLTDLEQAMTVVLGARAGSSASAR